MRPPLEHKTETKPGKRIDQQNGHQLRTEAYMEACVERHACVMLRSAPPDSQLPGTKSHPPPLASGEATVC